MPKNQWKVAILHYQPSGESPDAVVGQIEKSLKAGGHDPILVAVDDEVAPVLRKIQSLKPDLVFNVCETFADDYRMEVNVAALLEMARLPFTGSGTAGLLLAQDKILTKQLLQFHEVLTPRFAAFHGPTFQTNGDLSFPLIVKPAKSDASIGIGKRSIVNDWETLGARVREIREEFDDDALAEEFIEGREIYVGVIGDRFEPEVLPAVELDFGDWDKKQPKIANRDVKFGPEGKGRPKLFVPDNLSDELQGTIERAAKSAYRALKLRDYARIDFRVSARTNEPYVLEVNPNPYLESTCEVAMAAAKIGLTYDDLVNRIVQAAAKRYGLGKRQLKLAAPSHAAQ